MKTPEEIEKLAKKYAKEQGLKEEYVTYAVTDFAAGYQQAQNDMREGMDVLFKQMLTWVDDDFVKGLFIRDFNQLKIDK